MVPILYTTYGIAMGHRPEVLAASGGLRPATAAPMRASSEAARVRSWLAALIVRVRVSRRDVAGRPEGTLRPAD